MSNIIVKNAVERQAGYLYYIDKDGNLCEAKMSKDGRKKGSKNKNEKENLED